jgi:hypothetical protein
MGFGAWRQAGTGSRGRALFIVPLTSSPAAFFSSSLEESIFSMDMGSLINKLFILPSLLVVLGLNSGFARQVLYHLSYASSHSTSPPPSPTSRQNLLNRLDLQILLKRKHRQ